MVVVGGMYGRVMLVVVTTGGATVVGVVGAGGGAGAAGAGGGGPGHITFVPNRLHWLISFVRQRLNFPRFVIQPQLSLTA